MTEKKKFKSNLPPELIGQFSNPEVRKKADDTRRRNIAEKKAKKDAVKTGFERSVAAEPDQQAALIDRVWKMAMSDDLDMAKFGLKMLSDMGVTKQAAEKPEEPVQVTKRDPKKAAEFLKQQSKKED